MDIERLFENNLRWSNAKISRDPEFFRSLVEQQHPEFLWIGCSDSRVPANDIVGLKPGELFVHRNVANVVYADDVNCLSVIEYAIDVLRVKHVIVCGHYGCGGVRAAVEGGTAGQIDQWLSKIRELYDRNRDEIDVLPEGEARLDRLCELNVLDQVCTLSRLPVVERAWEAGWDLALHAWIYGLRDGLIKNLKFDMDGPRLVRNG